MEDFADRVGAGPEDRLNFTCIVVVDVLLPFSTMACGKMGSSGESLSSVQDTCTNQGSTNLFIFNREEGRDDALENLVSPRTLDFGLQSGARLKGFHGQAVNGRNTRSRE